MNPATLLRQMESHDVRLEVKGDRLRYEAPAGALTDALLSVIRENKPALLGLLSTPLGQLRDEQPVRSKYADEEYSPDGARSYVASDELLTDEQRENLMRYAEQWPEYCRHDRRWNAANKL